MAVAKIVKECYFEIKSEIDFKETENLFHLDASTDSTKPTVMYLPSSVNNIKRLKYNVGPSLDDFNFRELRYVEPVEFLEITDGWDGVESWIGVQVVPLGGQDFRFKYRNDESPKYWTSPDDRTILMDAFDSSYESTLTSARTYGYGVKVPEFLLEDNYIPDLDPRQFQLLLNSAKAASFIEIKQTTNDRAEKKERRHRMLAYKTHDRTDNRPAIYQHKGYGRCR